MTPSGTLATDGAEYRKRLERWLPALTAEADVPSFCHHLGDLRDAFARTVAHLEGLPDVDPSRDAKRLRQALAELNGELYQHMLPHMTELRPLLERLTRRLYHEAEKKGEL